MDARIHFVCSFTSQQYLCIYLIFNHLLNNLFRLFWRKMRNIYMDDKITVVTLGD